MINNHTINKEFYCSYILNVDKHFVNWHYLLMSDILGKNYAGDDLGESPKCPKCHMLAISNHINDRATNNQICFHWHHFCDLVNSWQYTAGHWVALIRLHLVIKLLLVIFSLTNKLWLFVVNFNEHTTAAFLLQHKEKPPHPRTNYQYSLNLKIQHY